ncbi:TPA: hypothetical protein ACHDTI_001721 [Campylobacter jejuni]|nr:hypothetical protein [Campylobacter lari]MCR6776402.1 hypothetical protein [Campylobacter lari]
MINKINLQDITSIAIKAGKSVLEIYNKDFKISYKDDNSPLSEADIYPRLAPAMVCGM